MLIKNNINITLLSSRIKVLKRVIIKMNKKQNRKICVFCGASSGKNIKNQQTATEIGKIIGDLNFDFVFGGGSSGLMGHAASSAILFGSKVYGVIPNFLTQREQPLEKIDLTITQTMRTRKAKMYKISSAFIILPGGIGTLDEFIEVLTLIQLNQIKNKPVLVLNTNDYWTPIFVMFEKMIKEGFLNKSNLENFIEFQNTKDLKSFLKSF